MQRQEFRAAVALAAVFSVRLLGLFMIYPVFASYAATLGGANPYLIGEALGIYGLTQGLLQIPFGLLSDRIGRKVMIVAGLALFAIGSAVAALSTSIGGVIADRTRPLQGAADYDAPDRSGQRSHRAADREQGQSGDDHDLAPDPVRQQPEWNLQKSLREPINAERF